MFPGVRWLGLILGVVLVWPVFAADDPKTDKKPPPKERLVTFKTLDKVVLKGVNAERKSVSVADAKGNVELLGSEDVKVRWLSPPPGFDEKGNIKKYTAKELAALKTDKLEGYPADFSNLKAGQVTKLVVKKLATAGKKLDKGDNGLRVTFIVILSDPDNK